MFSRKLSATFFTCRLLQYYVFVVLSNFLQKFLWSLKFFWIFPVLYFKNLFLNLKLFIIVSWNSLVIKGASLARIYCFLIGAHLLNVLKTVLFKSYKISVIKVALEYFRSELFVAKVFVITVFDNFRLSLLKTRFKFCYSK